jgi:hypothetical protein
VQVVFSAGNAAVVMVGFFGHLGGEEQVMGDPGDGGVLY